MNKDIYARIVEMLHGDPVTHIFTFAVMFSDEEVRIPSDRIPIIKMLLRQQYENDVIRCHTPAATAKLVQKALKNLEKQLQTESNPKGE